jgi:hypothetical protein
MQVEDFFGESSRSVLPFRVANTQFQSDVIDDDVRDERKAQHQRDARRRNGAFSASCRSAHDRTFPERTIFLSCTVTLPRRASISALHRNAAGIFPDKWPAGQRYDRNFFR